MNEFEMRCIECGRAHDMSRPAYACSSCGNLLEIRPDLDHARKAWHSADLDLPQMLGASRAEAGEPD